MDHNQIQSSITTGPQNWPPYPQQPTTDNRQANCQQPTTDNQQLNCEEVGEIMAQMPPWIIRWGMSALLGILLVVLAIGWWMKYPDVITSTVVLTTAHPPARVVARASGKISQFGFGENDQVAAGDLLASLDNPADTRAVLQLRRLLADSLWQDKGRPLPENLRLGGLQKDYGLFYRAYQELQLFRTLDPVAREISATRRELSQYGSLLEKQLRERDLLRAEVRLALKDYDRSLLLHQGKVLADKQLEDNERELIRTRRSLEQLETAMATTRIRLAELQKSLSLLAVRKAEQRSQYTLSFAEARKALLGALAQWEQQYLLRAPIAGKVTYLKFWAPNQYVRSGQEVMVIVPDQPQAVIGKVSLPIHNSGKVKVGQRVNIYLRNFPYQEFGILPGRVRSISLVPQDNRYVIEISLPAGLKTSYRKQLDFKQEMQGSAEIVTEDLRLLERIFYQVKALGRRS